jgi:hypothetical protein
VKVNLGAVLAVKNPVCEKGVSENTNGGAAAGELAIVEEDDDAMETRSTVSCEDKLDQLSKRSSAFHAHVRDVTHANTILYIKHTYINITHQLLCSSIVFRALRERTQLRYAALSSRFSISSAPITASEGSL